MSFSFRNAVRGIHWQGLLTELLILAGLAVYLNTFTVPFLFDDYPTLVDNSHLRRLWPLTWALQAPADNPLEGRPLASLSFALNYALSGLHVWSYHVVNILVYQGQLPGAIEHYRQALQSDPTLVEAHNNLGVVLIQLGELDAASDHFSAALRFNPTHAEVRRNLATALASREQHADTR